LHLLVRPWTRDRAKTVPRGALGTGRASRDRRGVRMLRLLRPHLAGLKERRPEHPLPSSSPGAVDGAPRSEKKSRPQAETLNADEHGGTRPLTAATLDGAPNRDDEKVGRLGAKLQRRSQRLGARIDLDEVGRPRENRGERWGNLDLRFDQRLHDRLE